jgi:hypothetical protein
MMYNVLGGLSFVVAYALYDHALWHVRRAGLSWVCMQLCVL